MSRQAISIIILFAMLGAPALAASNPAASNRDAPPGLIATSMKLTRLLSLNRVAAGVQDPNGRTDIEQWSYTKGDLTGTLSTYSTGDDFREDTVLGPFHYARGRYHGDAWEQNENGLTVRSTGIHRQDEIDEQALRRARESSGVTGVSLLGQTAVPVSAYVVKVAPPDGRVEYVFYDKDSYLVVRTERAVEDQRVVRIYDDFRTTNGEQSAWHIHETDGRPYNESDWQLLSLDDTTPINPTTFQRPANDLSHLTLNAPKVVLRGKILADRVILSAHIGRHTVDFQLDSGASQILLDKSVADALRLPVYGKQTQTTAGTYTATRSIVPHMDFGGASLENVAVMTAPFYQWADASTPIAGLLGFDFIANCIVHIDYLHGETDALDPASFQPPSGAFVIPIRLDDQVPAIPVKIGATTADRFIFDTGADRSMLFSQFIAMHPDESADQGLGEQFMEAYPFLDRMHGVGGEFKTTRTQVPSLALGSVTFPRWLFSVVHDAPGFEGEDYDGLIGQDVLRNFDVYLDYPDSKIYLVPNDRYHQRWG